MATTPQILDFLREGEIEEWVALGIPAHFARLAVDQVGLARALRLRRSMMRSGGNGADICFYLALLVHTAGRRCGTFPDRPASDRVK